MQGAGLLDEVMTLLCSYFSEYIVISHFNLFSCLCELDRGHVFVCYLTTGSLAVVSCCDAVCDTAEDVNCLV